MLISKQFITIVKCGHFSDDNDPDFVASSHVKHTTPKVSSECVCACVCVCMCKTLYFIF